MPKSNLNEDLSDLTKNEMYSLLMQLKRSTKYPRAKQVYRNTLRYFDDKCPGCGTSNEKSRLVRVYKNDPDFDVVTYICPCGCVYRKYEDKRKPIKGDLLKIIGEEAL